MSVAHELSDSIAGWLRCLHRSKSHKSQEWRATCQDRRMKEVRDMLRQGSGKRYRGVSSAEPASFRRSRSRNGAAIGTLSPEASKAKWRAQGKVQKAHDWSRVSADQIQIVAANTPIAL